MYKKIGNTLTVTVSIRDILIPRGAETSEYCTLIILGTLNLFSSSYQSSMA